MDEMMEQSAYRLNYDCTLFKYNEQILSNCKPFNCGEDDLNDLLNPSLSKILPLS